MRRYLMVAAAAATLAGLAPAGGALPAAPAPGTQVWVARFPASADSMSSAMAVSPHGSLVFITGASYGGPATGADYETIAYDAATGRQRWASRYTGGPGKHADVPTAVAVSPDGAMVFVTGYARGWGAHYDYATVAYSAATGRQLWASRYTSPGKNDDAAWSMAVSPDGSTVFVTGNTSSNGNLASGDNPGDNYATVAYRAATGRQLWASRYGGPANSILGPCSLAASRTGTAVFVTGTVYRDATWTGTDYATVAYSAATGKKLWASRYRGSAKAWDFATSVVVSPGGAKVFVTGYTEPGGYDIYATVGYSAATGRQLWASRYNGPVKDIDEALAVAVNPDGTKVFVTGTSPGRKRAEYATVAYGAATGRQLWASRYGAGNIGAGAYAVAVSPDGATVYVTGLATVAYSAATGKQRWVSRYSGAGAGSVAVSPDGATVFVNGSYRDPAAGDEYITIAYRG